MDVTNDFGQKVAVLQTTVSCDLNVRLTNLLSRTHYNLIQSNGQRIYGPPPNWTGPRPPRGCEIFVGRLPRDAFEDELIPVFSRPGKIYELRLMMEFSGFTRGFCFVVYVNRAGAERAVQMLHLFQIRPYVKITVYRSLDNSRLFVGGIPFDKTKEEVWDALCSVLKGVTNVIMYPNPYDKNKNRGYVFLDFASHRDAIEARKIMWPSRLVMWGAQLHVEWAVPIPVDSNLRKLLITNLSPCTSREFLTQFVFEKTKNPNSIVHVYRHRNFAIVQFTSRQNAQAALTALEGATIDGNKITVQWMKNKHKEESPRSPEDAENPRSDDGAEINQVREKKKKQHAKKNTWQQENHTKQNSPPIFSSSSVQVQNRERNTPNFQANIQPFQANSLELPPPLIPQFYVEPSGDLRDNTPFFSPMCYPPACPMPYNSFQPFLATPSPAVPMLSPQLYDAGMEVNPRFPPLRSTGETLPGHVMAGPSDLLDYAGASFPGVQLDWPADMSVFYGDFL